MNRWMRLVVALLLACSLPARPWAAQAMLSCAPGAGAAAAASTAAVSSADGAPSGHCADHPAASSRQGPGSAGDDCSTCGLCHLACGAPIAPAVDLSRDLLGPVLNAGQAGVDLSFLAAHAPPPPRT